MNLDNNPRYRKINDGEYEDMETGDLILELPEGTGNILKETFGLEPEEDGTFRLTPEVFKAIIQDPLDDLYAEDSDLKEL